MVQRSPIIDRPKQKLNRVQRKQLIPTLQIAGMTQIQIAEHLGVSRSTIINDLADLPQAAIDATDNLKSLSDEIRAMLPVKGRAEKYVELATKAKNEAVSLGALQRIDDLEGIVTDKERLRAKQSEQPSNQAMFILAPGMNISFGPSTTGSESKSLHNTSTAPPLPYIDVESESPKGGTVNKDE